MSYPFIYRSVEQPWSNENANHRKLVPRSTANLRWLVVACDQFELVQNFIASFFQLAKTCELFEHKTTSRWKSLVSKLNMAASDEVDVVLNQSNAHSESSKAKPAKAKWKKKKKKWSNSEIHKLIEEARTCLWDTFSMDYQKKCII